MTREVEEKERLLDGRQSPGSIGAGFSHEKNSDTGGKEEN